MFHFIGNPEVKEAHYVALRQVRDDLANGGYVFMGGHQTCIGARMATKLGITEYSARKYFVMGQSISHGPYESLFFPPGNQIINWFLPIRKRAIRAIDRFLAGEKPWVRA